MVQEHLCLCSQLDDIVIVGMGASDGLDERIFATLDIVCDHGGKQWWLYASTCNECEQHWMVAQEERIHDNFCLKRIDPMTMLAIVDRSHWPDDFLRYEQVLRLGRDAGSVAHFLDPQSPALIDTVKDLRCERPGISVEDIAYVLAIPTKSVEQLLKH